MTTTVEQPKTEPTATAAPKIEDLGLLDPGGKIFVGLLPSIYKAVMVKLPPEKAQTWGHNGFKVSCLIPPATHMVQIRPQHVDNTRQYEFGYDYRQHLKKLQIIKHKSPTLVLSLDYHDYPHPNNFGNGSIFAIDETVTDKISGIAYTLPNVDTNGIICFGGAGHPADLRSAHTRFWGSNFNHLNVTVTQAISKEVGTNAEYVRRWKSLVLEKARYKDLTPDLCGKKFWSSSTKADGILITNRQALLKLVPQKYWKRDTNKGVFCIALATKKDQLWTFNGGGFTFSVEEKNVQTLFSERKNVTNLRKKFFDPNKTYTDKPKTPKKVTTKKVVDKAEVAAKKTTIPKAKVTKPKAPKPKKEVTGAVVAETPAKKTPSPRKSRAKVKDKKADEGLVRG